MHVQERQVCAQLTRCLSACKAPMLCPVFGHQTRSHIFNHAEFTFQCVFRASCLGKDAALCAISFNLATWTSACLPHVLHFMQSHSSSPHQSQHAYRGLKRNPCKRHCILRLSEALLSPYRAFCLMTASPHSPQFSRCHVLLFLWSPFTCLATISSGYHRLHHMPTCMNTQSGVRRYQQGPEFATAISCTTCSAS